MDKYRHTLSATELSKFEYCPYQWYYERLYGINELKRLKRERNELLSITDNTIGTLQQGVDYHRDFFENARRKRRRKVIIALIILALLYFLLKGGITL